MTEFVFLDRDTRTLILTDLIENFEPAKLKSPLTRWLTPSAEFNTLTGPCLVTCV